MSASPNEPNSTSLNAVERFRRRMDDGHVCLGMSVTLPDPIVSEVAVEAGYDFIWIENEHSYQTTKDVLAHILTVRGTGVAPMVRVPVNDPAVIKPYVDMAPAAIVVPLIRSAEEAAAAVAACRYPPAGVRGFGPIRNMGHGRLEFDEYLEQAARQVMVIVQVEHVDAVEDLDALLDTPGLDGICLGRNDLSGSVGKLGRYDDPQVRGMIDTLLDKCAGRDIYLGASLGPDWESVKEWASRGMRWFGVGDDIDYVVGGARSTMAGFRAAMSDLDHK